MTDCFGNKLGATYPKRAKGLVKTGRARFVSDNVIEVKPKHSERSSDKNSPPDIKNLGDTKMEYTSNGAKPDKLTASGDVSLRDLLARLDMILHENQYINDAITCIKDIEDDDEDIVERKTEAIRMIVQSKETTNQQALTLIGQIAKALSVKE